MAMVITSFTPTTGPTTGGTRITITGTGLDTVDNVLIGAFPAQIDTTAVNSPTSLTFIAPAIDNALAAAFKVATIDNASTGLITISSGSYTYTSVSVPVLNTSLASKWKLDVDTSVGVDGTGYTAVRAITNFQPGVDATTQDDSDYDSGVWGSDVVTMNKWSLTITVDRKVAAGFVEDPGQKKLRALSELTGSGNVARVRWYDRNDTLEAYEGYGSVSWSEKGGSTSDKSSVDIVIRGRGARTLITNPS